MHVILWNRQENTTDADHCFITVGPNCWGRGKTLKESYQNCLANAPHGPTASGKKTASLSTHFITRIAPNDVQVDPMDGALAWSAKHDAKACKVCTCGKGISVGIKANNEMA